MSEDVKIIDGYRGPEDNEFFFRFDPWRAAGTRDLLTWIEESTDYTIIHIPESVSYTHLTLPTIYSV